MDGEREGGDKGAHGALPRVQATRKRPHQVHIQHVDERVDDVVGEAVAVGEGRDQGRVPPEGQDGQRPVRFV